MRKTDYEIYLADVKTTNTDPVIEWKDEDELYKFIIQDFAGDRVLVRQFRTNDGSRVRNKKAWRKVYLNKKGRYVLLHRTRVYI
jgi:GH43 family beta-xylosidase